VLTSAEVLDARGHIGKFVTRVSVNGQTQDVEHGAAIIATGGAEYRPTEYLYGEHPQVWTQREFHEFVGSRDERLQGLYSLVMIQCVGSREPEHPLLQPHLLHPGGDQRPALQGAQPQGRGVRAVPRYPHLRLK
jgi:heterodisulfide reductase subunit A-like polyferredoxin